MCPNIWGSDQAVISETEAKGLLAELNGVETETLSKQFFRAPNLSIKITFRISSKGNGILSLPGLLIRIYDEHDDRLFFDPPLLENEWVDLNQDGYRDLVVSGNAILTDEADKISTRHSVKATFVFDPKTQTFVTTQACPEIYVIKVSR
ncbi:MAG: hypothetical protein H6510_08860 [Acidobacteria bacterium]|nr:hypothetical protein [Acidobacteriota bacterium]